MSSGEVVHRGIPLNDVLFRIDVVIGETKIVEGIVHLMKPARMKIIIVNFTHHFIVYQ